MLLDLVIETHAWASSRPKHESTATTQKFEKRIDDIIRVEQEQGNGCFSLSSIHLTSAPSVDSTRERLNDFLNRMRTALAALSGL
jgi:hypothetical protein